MKTIKTCLALCLIFALCLTAAVASADAATLKSVQDAGKLVIASSPDFPPFESMLGDGSIVGIEIDIMNTVAEKLGVELVIEPVDFDSILLGLMAGSYDIGVSGFSVTEERKKNVLFTDPYCLAAQAIVVKSGSDIASKADLAGKIVSVQSGTTAELYCIENGYQVEAYKANVDAQLAALNGTVDAWVIDDLTAAEMVKAYNEANGEALVILPEAMTTEPYAFAFAFGSEDLVEAVNGIVNEMVADGTIAALFEKYDAPFTSPAQ